MIKTLAIAAAAGLASVALYATLLTGSMGAVILASLVQLPLFLAGLSLGAGAAAVATGVAGLAIAMTGGVVFAVAFLLINAVPVVVATYLALLNRRGEDGATQWYPGGRVISGLIAGPAGALLFAGLYFMGEPGGIEGVASRAMEQPLAQSWRLATGRAPQPDEIAGLLTLFAHVFPGVVAASWLTMLVANGALAQGLLVRFGWNLRPSPRMGGLEMPVWVYQAAVIAGLGALFPGLAGFMGVNWLIMFAAGFVFVGLAVIHCLLENRAARLAWLVALYGAVVLTTWPVAILAVLGAVEPWVGLRRRFAGFRPTE